MSSSSDDSHDIPGPVDQNSRRNTVPRKHARALETKRSQRVRIRIFAQQPTLRALDGYEERALWLPRVGKPSIEALERNRTSRAAALMQYARALSSLRRQNETNRRPFSMKRNCSQFGLRCSRRATRIERARPHTTQLGHNRLRTPHCSLRNANGTYLFFRVCPFFSLFSPSVFRSDDCCR